MGQKLSRIFSKTQKIRQDFSFFFLCEYEYEQGAMCEPLTVGIYACQRVKMGQNKNFFLSQKTKIFSIKKKFFSFFFSLFV